MGSELGDPLGSIVWVVLGYFVYGKKQTMIVPFVCGLALMVYPYFMPNTVALVLTNLVLIAIPYFFFDFKIRALNNRSAVSRSYSFYKVHKPDMRKFFIRHQSTENPFAQINILHMPRRSLAAIVRDS